MLVVGSNATSLEALYLMRHDARIRERVHSITVISRSGMLPYKICDEPPESEFRGSRRCSVRRRPARRISWLPSGPIWEPPNNVR